MSTFGPYNLVVGGPGNSPDGTLTLTYTLSGNSITNASFNYLKGTPNPPSQTYPVTFAAGVGGVFQGTFTCSPLLNIPGQGNVSSGTMSFKPPVSPALGTLTGTFTKATITEDPVAWEADSGTGPDPLLAGAAPKAAYK